MVVLMLFVLCFGYVIIAGGNAYAKGYVDERRRQKVSKRVQAAIEKRAGKNLD